MIEECARHKDFDRRLGLVEDDIKDLKKCVGKYESGNSTILYMIGELKKTVESLSKDINDLKGAPGKKWDTTVTVIITSIISCIVGLLVSLLFKL